MILGLSAGDVLLSIIAIALGVTHGASWLIALCAVGLIADVLLYRDAQRRAKYLTPETVTAFMVWVRKSGVRLNLLASAPIFVALAFGAHMLGSN